MPKHFIYFLPILLLILTLTCSWSVCVPQGIPPSPPSREEYGYIQISITDPHGRYLFGAMLYVYKGGGLFISRKISGGTSLRLPEGSYEIKVEKEGYASFSENVYIAKGKRLALQVTLKPAIEIAGSAPLNITLHRYQEEEFKLEVRNNGRWEEEVKLAVTLQGPPLVIPVIKVNGKHVVNGSIIRIDPKSSVNLELTLRTLDNCGETRIAIVLEYREIRISRSFTIKVAEDHQELLKTTVCSLTASPGEELSLTFSLLNPAWFSETFLLRCDAPAGWTVNVSYEGNAVKELTLEPASCIELTLRVRVPFDTPNGTYRIALEARGKTTNMSEAKVLEIVVKGAHSAFIVKAEKVYLDVSAGSLAKYPLVVLNRCSKNLLLKFRVDGLPNNYPFWIEDENGNRLSSLYIRRGEEIKVYLCVRVPEESPINTFNFSFIVSTSNQEYSVNLYLNVVGKYGIDIITENFLLEVYSGEEAVYNLEVKNTGSLELTNVTFKVMKCPQDVNVTVRPKEITMLKPGEISAFELRVKVKQGMPAGDYYLLFRIESDQVSTITYGLRISVRQRETSIFIAALVILLVSIILIVIYKKYGRR
ncbi:MAG: hypothetical protein DRP00_01080 [Candidatus Aenigmatarchaeota archaeon]|nr:MAG: hypothetical protein DRP00_01080 [Candidatus Aenigmarchaeota archaeon]